MKFRNTSFREHRSLAQRDMGPLQQSDSRLLIPAICTTATCAAVAIKLNGKQEVDSVKTGMKK